MSHEVKSGGYFETWRPIETYLTTGEGLVEAIVAIGDVAINSDGRLGTSEARATLARARDNIDYDKHAGAEAETIKSALEALLRHLESKEIQYVMSERKKENDQDQSAINEEIAFAATELGVTTAEVPDWMLAEIDARYYVRPDFIRDWIKEKRAEFDASRQHS